MEDFQDAFEMMLTVLKRVFKNALRADQVIAGDTIKSLEKSEQLEIVQVLLQDLIEILSNFQMIT